LHRASRPSARPGRGSRQDWPEYYLRTSCDARRTTPEAATGSYSDGHRWTLRRIGDVLILSSNHTQIERAEKIAPVISLQPPYSLIHRQIETETLPYCEKQGIGVIVYC